MCFTEISLRVGISLLLHLNRKSDTTQTFLCGCAPCQKQYVIYFMLKGCQSVFSGKCYRFQRRNISFSKEQCFAS